MANKSRFVVAESRITAFFRDSGRKVYSKDQLSEVLEQNRALWNLPFSMNIDKFIERLLNSEMLSKREVVFSGTYLKKERYLASDASVFQVAVSLVNKSYLSHYTAVYLHGLTNQIPKTIYISFEQSKKNNVVRELEQRAIDSAFSRPQRKSGTTTIYQEYTFLLHNGMYSNRSGVFSLNDLPVTNIERTLIDIAVRPAYAGGVDSVLDIYRRAIDKISINKLMATLEKLNFIYPYHQTIGFYLQKAGLRDDKLKVLHQKKMLFDFYLTYEISEKEYNSTWKIYHPKGM
jgi:hypothetical protein